MSTKRAATFSRVLVYMDEPQLILLKSYKANIIAVAIPSPHDSANFLATSVSRRDFEDYMYGTVDLRYLFTYAQVRSLYTFDLMTMSNGKIIMTPLDGEPPEDYLPSPRFFSRSHTEDDPEEEADRTTTQTLFVDGEWDMPDFGQFYNRYSDVYYFLGATSAFSDATVALERKRSIQEMFIETPFRGGFSYVNFYDQLVHHVPRAERLRMDKIKYESPGYVNVNGDEETFSEIKFIIVNFLENKGILRNKYKQLHSLLSGLGYLTTSGREFDNSTDTASKIEADADDLAVTLKIPNVDTIKKLVENNRLVYAKLMLSIHRRIDDASKFFAQSRVNF